MCATMCTKERYEETLSFQKILTKTPGRCRRVTPAAILQTHGCHWNVRVGVVTMVTMVAHLAADSVPVSIEGSIAHSLGDST